jgi:hypothetical protein
MTCALSLIQMAGEASVWFYENGVEFSTSSRATQRLMANGSTADGMIPPEPSGKLLFPMSLCCGQYETGGHGKV